MFFSSPSACSPLWPWSSSSVSMHSWLPLATMLRGSKFGPADLPEFTNFCNLLRRHDIAPILWAYPRSSEHLSGSAHMVKRTLRGWCKPPPMSVSQYGSMWLPGFLDERVEAEAPVLIAGCTHRHPW